ncbi:MAG: SPFH domain-containing protein [Clostridiales Family XIII bacterium]|nr:SPFH domain-containing protein [Clostridiales Family XIII bacterium]
MAQISQIIKYEGDNTTFVWKHPIEDFNSTTQLIVHESQEALFYMNGQALDLFPSGRYTLESQNIPLIGKYFNMATDGKTPFHCEVYFINKTEQMAIKWGTDSKVEYVEPTYNFPIQIGASGEMSLRAEDSRKLLIKIVGTEKELSQQTLTAKFRAFLMTRFKTYLANYMREGKINIFTIDEHLTVMSEAMRTKLFEDFAGYGLALEQFFITTIVKPEDDRAYQTFKELHFRQYADIADAQIRQQVGVIEQSTEAKRMVIEAEGLAQKRQTEGFTYQQERGFDVAEKVAQNEGVGEFSNMGIGLGMVSGVGGTVGSTVGGVVSNAMSETIGNPAAPASTAQATVACPSCGTEVPASAKFCPECGSEVKKPDDTMFCPNCGAKTPKGKFCIECGQKL